MQSIAAPGAIEACGLTKTYTFHAQSAGLGGAIRSVLRRRYETRLAVDRIDLRIDRGEVVGLLGPNGAGKTTTLKMLSGLLYPSGGELSVLGFRPSERKADYLRQIALVMGQKSMLWWDVPAMESFLLHKEMYELSTEEFDRSVAELAQLLQVEDLLDVQVRKVSLGERMKLELMAALLHRPQILFLDEPTIGLDVVATARVRSFLREINRTRGTTILLTSHDMDDIEALCSRVLIMDRGRIGYDGDLAELVRSTRPGKLVRATYAEPIPTDIVVDDLDGAVQVLEIAGQVLRLEVSRERASDAVAQLVGLGPLVDLDVTDTDIDDVVRELFSRDSVPTRRVGR